MNQKCFSCGIEKNLEVEEIYPYPEEETFTTEPTQPLFVIECSPSNPNKDTKVWKAAIVCHECWHKLKPDMWIDEDCWKYLNPVISFDKLPEFNYNEGKRWEPGYYIFPEIE